MDEQPAKRAEEVAASKAELRQRRNEDRRKRVLTSESSTSGNRDDVISGWVTIQSGDSLTWRKRFCGVHGQELRFFKDASVRDRVLASMWHLY